jgi:cytochrome P450
MVLFLLDQHPAVLDDVRAEIDAVLGDRDPTPSDLPRLALLNRVIKESMRVLPTAPVLFLRRVAEDTTLGGKPIPKNANVVVSPLTIHHDAKLYPDPRRFDPDRWQTLDPPVYTYMPFGAGPRTCTGMLFASQSLRLALPMILRRFRVPTIDGTRVDRLVRGNILHPKRGLRMRVERAAGRSAPPARVSGDIRELVTLDASST